MDLYKNLNRTENYLLNRNLALLKDFLNKIVGMVSTGEIGGKTFDWIKWQIEFQGQEYINEFRPYLSKELQKIFEQACRTAGESIGDMFGGIPTNAMLWFNENFLPLADTTMKNYAGDLMRTIENILTAGIISGTPTDVLTKILAKEIPQTAKRRVEVMVRDQIGNALQQGIYKTYKEYEDVIETYRWVGPSDNRTTKWCRNRKQITNEEPWTKEEVEKYISQNPQTLNGLEIRANSGTFLHPHIQCRHRLLAEPVSKKLFVGQLNTAR